jgi:hypothetical protein
VKEMTRPAKVELVADLGAVAVLRLNGRPRDPVDGRHRRAVVYVTADAGPGQVAALLRNAADELDRRWRVT